MQLLETKKSELNETRQISTGIRSPEVRKKNYIGNKNYNLEFRIHVCKQTDCL